MNSFTKHTSKFLTLWKSIESRSSMTNPQERNISLDPKSTPLLLGLKWTLSKSATLDPFNAEKYINNLFSLILNEYVNPIFSTTASTTTSSSLEAAIQFFSSYRQLFSQYTMFSNDIVAFVYMEFHEMVTLMTSLLPKYSSIQNVSLFYWKSIVIPTIEQNIAIHLTTLISAYRQSYKLVPLQSADENIIALCHFFADSIQSLSDKSLYLSFVEHPARQLVGTLDEYSINPSPAPSEISNFIHSITNALRVELQISKLLQYSRSNFLLLTFRSFVLEPFTNIDFEWLKDPNLHSLINLCSPYPLVLDELSSTFGDYLLARFEALTTSVGGFVASQFGNKFFDFHAEIQHFLKTIQNQSHFTGTVNTFLLYLFNNPEYDLPRRLVQWIHSLLTSPPSNDINNILINSLKPCIPFIQNHDSFVECYQELLSRRFIYQKMSRGREIEFLLLTVLQEYLGHSITDSLFQMYKDSSLDIYSKITSEHNPIKYTSLILKRNSWPIKIHSCYLHNHTAAGTSGGSSSSSTDHLAPPLKTLWSSVPHSFLLTLTKSPSLTFLYSKTSEIYSSKYHHRVLYWDPEYSYGIVRPIWSGSKCYIQNISLLTLSILETLSFDTPSDSQETNFLHPLRIQGIKELLDMGMLIERSSGLCIDSSWKPESKVIRLGYKRGVAPNSQAHSLFVQAAIVRILKACDFMNSDTLFNHTKTELSSKSLKQVNFSLFRRAVDACIHQDLIELVDVDGLIRPGDVPDNEEVETATTSGQEESEFLIKKKKTMVLRYKR